MEKISLWICFYNVLSELSETAVLLCLHAIHDENNAERTIRYAEAFFRRQFLPSAGKLLYAASYYRKTGNIFLYLQNES